MASCKFSKVTCSIYCLVILGVISIVLAIVLPIFIESIIKTKAQDQVVMTSNNFQLWGMVPGQSESKMQRLYYLYNLSNPDDFLYNNARPEFIEVGPYVYDEFQNYTNLNFTTNKNNLEEINYKFWQYYTHQSGNPQDKINSLNLGSLGVWHQAKNVPKHKMALQVMSNLILGLEDQLMNVGLAQGIQTFFKDQKTFIDVILKPCRIPKNLYDLLWNDEEYGWKNWTSLKVWVKAAQEGVNSDSSLLLKDHFHLSFSNLYGILNGPFSQWILTTESLMKNWYCQNKNICDSRYLAVIF